MRRIRETKMGNMENSKMKITKMEMRGQKKDRKKEKEHQKMSRKKVMSNDKITMVIIYTYTLIL